LLSFLRAIKSIKRFDSLFAPVSGDLSQAIREGIAETIVEAGAMFANPSCHPCNGGNLASGEIGISAGPRHFRGRMGSPESSLYCASQLRSQHRRLLVILPILMRFKILTDWTYKGGHGFGMILLTDNMMPGFTPHGLAMAERCEILYAC